MTIIPTKSFQVAAHVEGDENSPRLAIALPGRLDTKDYAHMKSHVSFLAAAGFLALSVDVPGTWESPGSLDHYSTTLYLKLVHELIEYFGNRPTLLIGHSRGGTIAMLSSDLPSVRAIIAVMASYGPPSPPDQHEIVSGHVIEYRDAPGQESDANKPITFNLPLSYFTDGQKYDPVAVLKRCTKPKLLIYGSHDEFTQTHKIESLYENIPAPKMLAKLESDHDYRFDHSLIEKVNALIDNFLTVYPL